VGGLCDAAGAAVGAAGAFCALTFAAMKTASDQPASIVDFDITHLNLLWLANPFFRTHR
jgi:hypothetical protein